MSTELPVFALFADPVGEGVFKRGEARCDACGRARGWVYDGPVYSAADEEPTVCPWCIADGTAAAKLECTFNDGTIFPMLPGTAQLTEEDRVLVEERTPGFTTWQGNHWMMCCGRACVYLGEAKPGDLEPGGRFEGAAEAIFEDDEERDEEEKAEILEQIGGGEAGAYVFRCATCGGMKGYWDAD